MRFPSRVNADLTKIQQEYLQKVCSELRIVAEIEKSGFGQIIASGDI